MRARLYLDGSLLNGGKCSGDRPACKSCIDRKVPDHCRYELHPRTAKEEMVRKIRELQRDTERLEQGIEEAQKKNMCLEAIMSSLKHGSHCEEIVRRIKQDESYQSIAQWLNSLATEQSREGSSRREGEAEQYSTRAMGSFSKELPISQSGAYGSSQSSSTRTRNRMDIESMLSVEYGKTIPCL